MKKDTERALWIGGSALAAAGVITIGVLATRKSAAAPSPGPIETPPPPTPPTGSTGGKGPAPTPTQTGTPKTSPSKPFQSAVSVAGPYKSLMSNTLQPYETYLLEIPPQSGETLASFGAYMAKIAPAPLTVAQSFDVGPNVPGWPSVTTGVWRYVLNYGPTTKTGTFATPVWKMPPAFASAAIWATQGNAT